MMYLIGGVAVISCAAAIILYCAIVISNRNNRKVIFVHREEVGLINEYKNRYELDWHGPWGESKACYYDKGAIDYFKTKLMWFKDNYVYINPDVIRAVKEAKEIASEDSENWEIESIICDGPDGQYSLLIDIPGSKKIPWGIGIELENGKIREWEFVH
jgi:hypothetical protein